MKEIFRPMHPFGKSSVWLLQQRMARDSNGTIMLRDAYLHLGLGGTVLVGGLVMLTAFSWFVAMAGAVTRPMTPLRRGMLLAVLTALPPSAILVFARFVAVTRGEYRTQRDGAGAAGRDSGSELRLHGSRLPAAA
jgi:hypothetical protein